MPHQERIEGERDGEHAGLLFSRIRLICSAAIWALGIAVHAGVFAADPIFSGPQPGERTTPFRVLDLASANEGKERDPIAENDGAPTALVFVHAIERSLVPLLRVVDQYGAERKDSLRTEIIFLVRDRLEGEQRVTAASRSLQLKSRVGISLDGAEGPGNYGLNKDCMMTILAAKENKVTANFALVQPGIADAPKVIEALAKVCGDTAPPAVEQLTARAMPRGNARSEGRMQMAGQDYPGAVPNDAKLNSLLRQLIRPTNDAATVDRLLAEMEGHVKGNAELTKQAVDGWTRVLHFGDRYGTVYARDRGKEFLQKLQAADKE